MAPAEMDMRRFRRVLVGSILVLGLGMGVEELHGQGDPECDVPSHGGLVMRRFTSAVGEDRVFYFKVPTIRCPGGVRIRADSAVVYESSNYNQLWGNVIFWDEDSRLSADQAQYFTATRRLVARGNAVLTDLAEGSVIRGDEMVLIRAGPDREEDYLTVTGRRPHATLYPARQQETVEAMADSSGAAEDSLALLPDTSRVTGEAPVPPTDTVPIDTLSGAERPASLAISPDSLTAPMDPLETVADSLASAEDPPEVVPDTLLGPGEVPEPPEGPIVPAGQDRVPYEIDAQEFLLEGNRYFRATGSVDVTRDSLHAQADSLEYDQDQGVLVLSREASVTTAETDLSAETIHMTIPRDEIREARATGDAVLEGEDLRLLAPIVTLFFQEGAMDRLVAVRDAQADSALSEMTPEERERNRLARGIPPLVAREMGVDEFPRRPYALARDFVLEGDSVEVLAPGEVIQEVKAMGDGRGESMGRDSLNQEDTPALISRDWLAGDTIIAYFQHPSDPPAVLEDSLRMPADSLTLPGDSLILPGDSLILPGDSLILPGDSLILPGDSVPGQGDPLPADDDIPGEREPGQAQGESEEPEYQLERLVAKGGARSMYRMAPSDSTVAQESRRLAIHYVVGEEIMILLNEEGEAERMEVVGQTRGIHLEPQQQEASRRDTLQAKDTTAAPDTLTPPDTLLRPDTLPRRDTLPRTATLAGPENLLRPDTALRPNTLPRPWFLSRSGKPGAAGRKAGTGASSSVGLNMPKGCPLSIFAGISVFLRRPLVQGIRREEGCPIP